MKLAAMLTLIFLAISVLAISSGGYYLYSSSKQALTGSILAHLETTAESRAEHIETYLEDNIEELELIASRTQLLLDVNNFNAGGDEKLRAEISKKLADSKNSLDEIDRVCFIGLDGVIQASSNKNFIGSDVSAKEVFLKGRSSTGVYFEKEDDSLKLFFYGPFKLDGKVLGVAVMVIYSDELKEIIADKTGLGKTGEVLVALKRNGESFYFFERAFEDQAVPLEFQSAQTSLPMKEALDGNEVLLENALDYRNVPVIAATRFVEIGKLGLVAKIDLSEALGEPTWNLSKMLIVSIILSLIFVCIAALIVSKKVSEPIISLTKKIGEITHGKLDTQLDESRIFETQSLIDSLNRVLASMKLAILRTSLTKEDLGLGEIVKAKEAVEDKYKTLFDSSRDAIMIIEPPLWKFTVANPATLKLFGAKSVEEFTSKTPGQLSPKKQPDGELSSVEAKKRIEEALRNGSSSFNWTHKKLSGKEFSAHVLLSRVGFGDKALIQATVRDLPKEKK